jgi:Carboxypeptidase regulatory-like domain
VGPESLAWLSLSILLCAFPALTVAQSLGNITGTVVDQTGAAVAGARVTLANGDQSPTHEIFSGGDGQFSFANVAPGPFHLTITAAGFATQISSGILRPGDFYIVPPITLAVAASVTKVVVEPPREEVAETQMKEEEKQRVLGIIPNFYVTYISDPAPLDTKQKFELAWRTTVDPVSFVLTGAIAGFQQGENEFSGYGQGAQGYAKRYGASYANLVTSTFIEGAILPSLLKQDPRYYYKGSGSTRSRILYAIANTVICKGDNGHWEANYSGLGGSLASGGISNLYYPRENRGVGLTFENAAVGLGTSAVENLFEEFLVTKFTPKLPKHQPPNP